MSKEISAGAVVYFKNKDTVEYLLLHYESGHWDFPKGHIEEGEEHIDTVEREIEEETGIKEIDIIDGFKEHIKYSFRNSYNKEMKKGAWIFKLVNFYLAEANTKEVKLSSEHTGYKWLQYKEALKQINYKNSKEILIKADKFLKKT